MRRYLNAYYISNFLLILVYPMMRWYHFSRQLKKLDWRDEFGFTKENSILFIFSVIMVVKYLKAYTPAWFVD